MLRTTNPLEKILNKLEYSELSSKIHFRIGVRTNGIPHIGTWLTIGFCFAIARKLRNSVVHIQLLDNSTDEGPDAQYRNLKNVWMEPYESFAGRFSKLTSVAVEFSRYSEDQLQPDFRRIFLKSLAAFDRLKQLSPLQALLPGKTLIGIRLLCPKCGLFDKDGKSVKLVCRTETDATFECMCPDHGRFEEIVSHRNSSFLNLTAIYRNIVKEALLAEQSERSIIMKGSDWLYAALVIDEGLEILECTRNRPSRIFTPLVTTDSGIKLSKTWIAQRRSCYRNVDQALLHMASPDVEGIIVICEKLLLRTDHSFDFYTCSEMKDI